MNDLQLECQKLGADMTLSFGCIVFHKKCVSYSDDRYWIWTGDDTSWAGKNLYSDEIIGHPLTRGRLCYLQRCNQLYNKKTNDGFVLLNKIDELFARNPELYQQTILEWDEETIKLVRNFLISIQQHL